MLWAANEMKKIFTKLLIFCKKTTTCRADIRKKRKRELRMTQTNNITNHNEALTPFFANLETLIVGVMNLRDSNRGLTLSIDAPFGFGKTHFIDLLIQRINKNKNQLSSYLCEDIERLGAGTRKVKKDKDKKIKVFPIRYNAWEDDYQKDPFIALAGQIYQKYSSELEETEANEKQKSVLKKFGDAICALDLSLSYCGVDVGGNIGKIVEAFSSSGKKGKKTSILDQYLGVKSKIDNFKIALAEIIDKETIKLIIIDELDRCNPIYSMQLLELIKHLFGAKNTVFLLTIHKGAMLSHIKHCYGYDQEEGECYLSKFFDFELTLPLADNFTDKVIDSCDDISNDKKQIFIGLAKSLNISTRDQLKLIEQIKFLNKIWVKNFRTELLMLMILKIASYKDFQRLKKIASTANSLDDLSKIIIEMMEMFKYKKNQSIEHLKEPFILLSFAFVYEHKDNYVPDISGIITSTLGLDASEIPSIIQSFSINFKDRLPKKHLIQLFSLADSACNELYQVDDE